MSETKSSVRLSLPVRSVSRDLACWAAAVQYEDLPDEVVRAAKSQILDTLAVAWAATGSDGVLAIKQSLCGDGSAGAAILWGFGDRASIGQAAFFNAMLASALDFDCLHSGAAVHASAVAIPAAFALTESHVVTGRELLTSVVVGSEIAYRLGMAARSHPGWFYSSVLGIFAAACAASRVLKFDGPQLLNSLGVALSQCAGTQQPLLERSLTKRLQTAFAARGGVEAAMLTKAGISGPSQPFEGVSALGLYTPLDLDTLTKGLGDDYAILGVTQKKYPSCMCNHAPIEAALFLARGQKLDLRNLEEATIEVTPFMHKLVGAEFEPGSSPQVSAQFSVQYSVASALLRERFEVDDITPTAVIEAAVVELAGNIKVAVVPGDGKYGPARLILRTRGGAPLVCLIDWLPGSPATPLSATDQAQKALSCFRSGATPLTESLATELIAATQSIDAMSDVRELISGKFSERQFRH